MDDYVRGDPITSAAPTARRGAANRVCAEEGCGTRLSIYNDGRHCSLHAPMVVPRTRGRKLPAA